MQAKIVTLPGDGIGPEIMAQAIKVLGAVANKCNHTFNFEEKNIGGIAIDEEGCSLPQATIDACQAADAVMLGAVGGPVGDHKIGRAHV